MTTKFLVKATVLFLFASVGWERLPVADYYHRALAACTTRVFRLSTADDIVFADGEFVTPVTVQNRKELLHLQASDLTMNICVLAAVYFASPRRRRLFAWCCSAAFLSLFALHVISLHVTIRAALAWQSSNGISSDVIGQLGPWMYPIAMLLWVPYVAMCCFQSGARHGTRQCYDRGQ
jgi:hypothetical protein